jgi:hypothetical protein
VNAAFLVRLYPRAWRERYGDEFEALVTSQAQGPRLWLDVLMGALDARMAPQAQVAGSAEGSGRGGQVMKLLTIGCCTKGLSRSEQIRYAVLMVGASLGISLFYLWINRVWGKNLWIEALGIAAVPCVLFGITVQAYYRRHSLGSRLLLIAGLTIVTYLGSLLAAWL